MHTWTWAYTVVAFLVLLVSFLFASAVLLLRSRRRGYRTGYVPTPDSRSTPLGHWRSYWDEDTIEMMAPGVEQARERNYATKGDF